MATQSRHHHEHAAMRGSRAYRQNRSEQDGAFDDIPPFYANVGSNMPPESSPAWSQFQHSSWQPEASGPTGMDFLQSWGSSQLIDNEPVLVGWQPGPTEIWKSRRRDTDPSLNQSQFWAPTPFRPNGAPIEPLLEAGKTFGIVPMWQPGWVEAAEPAVMEVMPSIESTSVERESSLRAAKRRRPSPASSTTLSDHISPVAEGFVQHSPASHVLPVQRPVDSQVLSRGLIPEDIGVPVVHENFSVQVSRPVAKRRRAPTPTIDNFDFDEPSETIHTIEPSANSEEVLPFIPSVRIIDDGRDPATKERRGSDAVFKTQSSNTKRGHYASEVWEQHKPIIKKLYIDESKPLREVMETMEKEHQFPATQRMYKARFKQWGFVKNNTEKVVSQILRAKFQRDAAGKLSQFTRNGKDVNLQTYLQRKGMTEYDLVDFQAGPDALAHVRCRTPPLDVPQDLRLPDRLRFQDTLVLSFKRSFLLWRQQEESSAFGHQPSVFTWRVTDFPHLSSLIESARLIRNGDGASGVAALNRAFWAMETYLTSMDATASFYFFFHRQSRPWQEDARVALAVWKFLAAYASARNHNNHPLFHAFKLMYEVIQKEGVPGLTELLSTSSNTVADELERSFGRDHWMKDLIWHRCFPEKSKLRHLQLIRDMRDNGPTKKIVKRLY